MCRLGFDARIDIGSTERLHDIAHYSFDGIAIPLGGKKLCRFALQHEFALQHGDAFGEQRAGERNLALRRLLEIEPLFVIGIERHPSIGEELNQLEDTVRVSLHARW